MICIEHLPMLGISQCRNSYFSEYCRGGGGLKNMVERLHVSGVVTKLCLVWTGNSTAVGFIKKTSYAHVEFTSV